MGKILRISLKLNFTPNTSVCYGLILFLVIDLDWLAYFSVKFNATKEMKTLPDLRKVIWNDRSRVAGKHCREGILLWW